MAKAILVVDMLNDFVQEDGKLPVQGAKDIVENIKKIKEAAVDYNVLLAYANDAHTEDDKEFEKWPKHAVIGTYGAEVIEELAPIAGDLVYFKNDLSVFINEHIDLEFRARKIEEIYVTGVATEYCVRAAILETETKHGCVLLGAIGCGYKVNLVVDAIAGVDLQKGDQYRALIEMGNAGVRPVYTKQVLEELVK